MCSLRNGHFYWNNKIQSEFTHFGHLEIEANKLENLHPPATLLNFLIMYEIIYHHFFKSIFILFNIFFKQVSKHCYIYYKLV